MRGQVVRFRSIKSFGTLRWLGTVALAAVAITGPCYLVDCVRASSAIGSVLKPMLEALDERDYQLQLSSAYNPMYLLLRNFLHCEFLLLVQARNALLQRCAAYSLGMTVSA